METKGLSLREYVDQRLAHEKELRETIADKLSESLRLAHTETQRRLDELNHAHTIAADNWRTSLPREIFDQYRNEQGKWKDEINALSNKIFGAFILLGFMGLAGVVALAMGIARMAGILD